MQFLVAQVMQFSVAQVMQFSAAQVTQFSVAQVTQCRLGFVQMFLTVRWSTVAISCCGDLMMDGWGGMV